MWTFANLKDDYDRTEARLELLKDEILEKLTKVYIYNGLPYYADYYDFENNLVSLYCNLAQVEEFNVLLSLEDLDDLEMR